MQCSHTGTHVDQGLEMYSGPHAAIFTGKQCRAKFSSECQTIRSNRAHQSDGIVFIFPSYSRSKPASFWSLHSPVSLKIYCISVLSSSPPLLVPTPPPPHGLASVGSCSPAHILIASLKANTSQTANRTVTSRRGNFSTRVQPGTR